MITPADQLLARSDTALPGLDCLLDTDWVSHALEAELGLDAADLALRSTYIRYKRGTSCLVGFTGIHQHKRIDFYARLHCPDDQPKAAKPLASRLTESEFGPGALLLPDPCLVFLFFPNDHLMKPLQRLVDHQRRHKVLRDLLPRHSPASAAVLTPLRYKPPICSRSMRAAIGLMARLRLTTSTLMALFTCDAVLLSAPSQVWPFIPGLEDSP
jgi:hypothetical protein